MLITLKHKLINIYSAQLENSLPSCCVPNVVFLTLHALERDLMVFDVKVC